jgi:hypothetical protein
MKEELLAAISRLLELIEEMLACEFGGAIVCVAVLP